MQPAGIGGTLKPLLPAVLGNPDWRGLFIGGLAACWAGAVLCPATRRSARTASRLHFAVRYIITEPTRDEALARLCAEMLRETGERGSQE